MAGTKSGGRSAYETNIKLYGADFYSRIGKIGGKKSRTGGFYGNPEAARLAGSIGGKKSRRKGVKNKAKP